MNNYFLVSNDVNGNVSIDDSYVNLCLSRKIAVSALPIVTVSDSSGYFVKGSNNLREITLTNDEIFAAVGGYTDRRCPFFIWHCLKESGQEYEIKHFLCPAGRINGDLDMFIPALCSPSGDTDNEETGLSSDYAPYDLYIYTFSKNNNSNQERLGFQIFNENGEIVFDSTNKYLNAIRSSFDISPYLDFPNDKALAVIDVEPFGYYDNVSGTATGYEGYFAAGHVLFESGWQSRRSGTTPFPKCHIGMGVRQLYNPPYRARERYQFNAGGSMPHYIVVDVTGF